MDRDFVRIKKIQDNNAYYSTLLKALEYSDDRSIRIELEETRNNILRDLSKTLKNS